MRNWPGTSSISSPISGAEPRDDWGFDHGTWSVLLQLRPKADLPVLQLSIDRRQPPAYHLAVGRALAPLRNEGVLLLGSGNIVHNLRHALRSPDRELPDWAEHFDLAIASALEQRDAESLVRAIESEAGRQSHPTLEHFLPLLYVAGALSDSDSVSFPVTGFDLGSLSMRCMLAE